MLSKGGVKAASLFSIAGQLYNIAIRFATNLILTRLVTPEDFGLMAVANIILLGTTLVSEVGLRQAIIRSESDVSGRLLRTIFTVQVARGALLALVLLLLSGVLIIFGSSFPGVYSNPLLPYVIALISLNPLMVGFESTKIAVQGRNLTIGWNTLTETGAQTLGLAVGILAGLNGFGVWALAIGPLVAGLFRVIMSHTLIPGRADAFGFDREVFVEVFHFGKWVFLASLLGFVCFYGDQVILAAWLNEHELAMLALCFFMLGIVRQLVSKFANEVAFSKLSQVNRTQGGDVRKHYYKLRAPLDVLLLSFAGGCMISGEQIIQFLYDPRFSDAGLYLGLLSLAMIFDRYLFFNSLLVALNAPKIVTQINLLRVILLVIGLPLALGHGGIEWAVLYLGLYRIATLPLIFFYKMKYGVMHLGFEALSLLGVIPGVLAGFCFNFIMTLF